jgi:peptidoglycan/LPS O-acetylase OafA/YrhL
VLQVMPVFFAVGGYVHLTAWRSAESTGAFLRRRVRRLGLPLVPVLVGWSGVEVVLVLAGRPPLVLTAQGLFTPLWFLAVYAAAAAVVPVTTRWRDRWGAGAVVAGAFLLLGLDLLRLLGATPLGVVTTALAWLLCHQLGYLWRDDVVRGPRHGLLLAGGAVLGLALLTGPGPYPPSMVASAEHGSNMLPTTPPILLVGVLQLGLVTALYAPLARLLRHPRWWRPVVAVNALAMSIYLWHMAAALLLVVLVERAIGPLPALPDPGWWWSRPVWLAAVLVVLLGLLAAVRRWEVPR